MIHHDLKLERCYFEASLNGSKKFEIRYNNDRGFNCGDTVKFNEVSQGLLTGRFVCGEILCVTNYEQKEGYVVFGWEISKCGE